LKFKGLLENIDVIHRRIKTANDDAASYSSDTSAGQKRKLSEQLGIPTNDPKIVEFVLKERRMALEAEKKALEAKKGKLHQEVAIHIERIKTKHFEIERILGLFADKWGNETNTNTTNKVSGTEISGSTGTVANEAKPKSDPQHMSPEYLVEFSIIAQDEEIMAELQKKECKNAARAQSFMDLATNLSGMLNFDDSPGSVDKDKVQTAVNSIVDAIFVPDFPTNPAKRSTALNIRGVDETWAAQPIIHALIYRVLKIIELHHLFVSKEQEVQGAKKSARRMDFLVHKMREHLIRTFPSMIEGIVEVKRCEPNAKNDDRLIERAVNQIAGNFAKRLRADLNFLGIGMDCELYGVAISLSKISIVKASLTGVGTADVKATFSNTNPVKLLTEEGIERLALALNASHHLSKANSGIATMEASKGDLKLQVGKYLGSGAFGIVYSVKVTTNARMLDGTKVPPPADHFIKLPTSYRASRSLNAEASTLQGLANKVPNIPKFHTDDVFNLSMNAFVGKTHGLLLEGMIGEPADRVDWTEKKEQLLRNVIENIHKTLTAAHNNSVYHLDIRPGNIIVKMEHPSQDVKVLVIDWGVALKKEDTFKFRGCLPYAHDELLVEGRKAGKPSPYHDWASLLYTYFHLEKGEMPWHILKAHGQRNCDVQKRKMVVSEWWRNKLEKSEELNSVFKAIVSEASCPNTDV